MKYILLKDLDDAEEVDDGIYLVKVRTAEEPSNPLLEPFSEGDMYRIRKRRPEHADSLLFKDDWMFYDSKSKTVLGYVFKD